MAFPRKRGLICSTFGKLTDFHEATVGSDRVNSARSRHPGPRFNFIKFVMTSTFAFSPDSFWLRVPAQVGTISIKPFVTSFGETDELLCYVGETLLGKLVECGDGEGKVISLLPTLDRNRAYLWPSSDMFLQALMHVLRDESNAILSCERDIDQEPVLRLTEYDDVAAVLTQVAKFSKDGTGTCPTFLYQKM